ncbi:MAG TPA: nucleotidyltransferase domain-containing protein [Burkholderiales bacterium]|nr:nucleotidyltransferase domain-containing protein [Burkholderiales bacterium]
MSDLDLPKDVAQGLADFVAAAKSALGTDLVSIVLFGSAAEGRLRATSDVNVIIVLSRLDPARMDALGEPLRVAHAVIGLSAMLLLESEIAAATEAFAVKFSDIRARHKVLAGKDPFTELAPSRNAMLVRLRQILLNFILRTRERYALASLREEQLAKLVADAAAPLRSAAALILALEGRPPQPPKAALETLVAEIDADNSRELLANLSKAREEAALPPGIGRRTTLGLIELAQALRARAEKLS